MNISTDTLPAPVRHGLSSALPESDAAIWNRLGGGRTNWCWRGDTGNDSIVVKLFTDGGSNPLFPNEPCQEARVLQLLSGRQLAPELLAEFETPLGHCIAYRHVTGELWRTGTFEAGQLMRRLHDIAPPTGLRNVETTSESLEEHALKMSPQARQILPLLPTRSQLDSTPPVFLHGDIVAGNLIRSPTGLTLIDWQAPGLGDACHDIAVFLSPAMMQLYRGAPLSRKEIEDFFKGYESTTTHDRYRLLNPWLNLRLFAYCLWKAEQGDQDYRSAAQLELDALKDDLANYPR